jgi:DNA-binding CsgD family transcriptional regulator
MIPQGRDVRTESDVAGALGVPLHEFRRKHRDELEERVTMVSADEGRVRLYDAEQADAYTSGRSVPPGPDLTAEEPGDLLSQKEVADALGITGSTVRSYVTAGYLPAGVDRHGKRWPRSAVTARLEAGDRRESPELTGTGRPAGDPTNRGRAGRQGPHPRAVEVAGELQAAEHGARGPVSPQEVADRYGIAYGTAQRVLAEARKYLSDKAS